MSDSTDLPTSALVEGQVYFAAAPSPISTGAAGLYVRTEELPGDGEPHAYLVLTHDRVVYSHRCPRSRFAAEWTVDYTPPADALAAAVELAELRAERRGLVAAMRKAAQLAPEHRKALQATYRKEKH